MVTKKDLVIAILATFCLMSTLFTMVPTRSQSTREYDPWVDINDDGHIDGKDVAWIAKLYDTSGTPINKTDLLLELQARIDSLNYSLLDLEAYFETRINTLEAALIEQQSRTADLETKLIILNATKLGKPDYDSGWLSISKGESKILTHNLDTIDVLVYMIGKYSNTSSPYIHQRDYGGELSGVSYYGAYWSDLTETTIRVNRQGQDTNWEYIRVVIWKIP